MFKKVAPYIGNYKKYTIAAVVLMAIGIVLSVMPYYFLYQIIAPLTRGEASGYKCIHNLHAEGAWYGERTD